VLFELLLELELLLFVLLTLLEIVPVTGVGVGVGVGVGFVHAGLAVSACDRTTEHVANVRASIQVVKRFFMFFSFRLV
jgi:hypothetical protein